MITNESASRARAYVDASEIEGMSTLTFSVYVEDEFSSPFLVRVMKDGQADVISYEDEIPAGEWVTLTVDLEEMAEEFAFQLDEATVIYVKDIAVS
jgi:hypothetical protein